MAPKNRKPRAVTAPRPGLNVVSITKQTASGTSPSGSGQVVPAPRVLPTSRWRSKYRVHPAADVFQMMLDDELVELGENIKEHGLKHPIHFFGTGDDAELMDGRNRLEAMERIGIIDHVNIEKRYLTTGDPVEHIIGLNVHRRHLTKEQRAEMIVAAVKAAADHAAKADMDGGQPAEKNLAKDGEVSKGGRGKVDKVKAVAVATAKKQGIGKRTVERALAKAEGRVPAPSRSPRRPISHKPQLDTHTGIDAARRYYLAQCDDPAVDLDAEQETIIDALREIAGRRRRPH
jgi:hypothetical protein